MIAREDDSSSSLETICHICDGNVPPIPLILIPHKGPRVIQSILQLGIELPPPGTKAHLTSHASAREMELQLRSLNVTPLIMVMP